LFKFVVYQKTVAGIFFDECQTHFIQSNVTWPVCIKIIQIEKKLGMDLSFIKAQSLKKKENTFSFCSPQYTHKK